MLKKEVRASGWPRRSHHHLPGSDVQELIIIPLLEIVTIGRDASHNLNCGSKTLEMICLKYLCWNRIKSACSVLFLINLQVSEKIEKVTKSNWPGTLFGIVIQSTFYYQHEFKYWLKVPNQWCFTLYIQSLYKLDRKHGWKSLIALLSRTVRGSPFTQEDVSKLTSLGFWLAMFMVRLMFPMRRTTWECAVCIGSHHQRRKPRPPGAASNPTAVPASWPPAPFILL